MIPEHIVVEVGGLHLGQSIHAGEVKLPEGATTVTPASIVIVSIVTPNVAADDAAPASGAVEPELIRKEKAADADAKS